MKYQKFSILFRAMLLIGLGVFMIFFGQGYFILDDTWRILMGSAGLALGIWRLIKALRLFGLFGLLFMFLISCQNAKPVEANTVLIESAYEASFTDVVSTFNALYPSDSLQLVGMEKQHVIKVFLEPAIHLSLRTERLSQVEEDFFISQQITVRAHPLAVTTTQDTLYAILKEHQKASAYRFVEYLLTNKGQRLLQLEGFTPVKEVFRDVKVNT